jgi:6-hydroxy-3-succinoylpyridine 3-monooxygenase
MDMPTRALRTRVYIDGYNFYYGCLKRSHDKWLDPLSLFQNVLPTILYSMDGHPVSFALEPLAIKFFTAPILKNYARSDDSVSSQATYHNALNLQLGNRIEIVKGYYDSRAAKAHRVIPRTQARDSERIEIWKLEEKQSDVSLALHAFSDAIRGEVDQVVIVTNDTDLAPAVQMIKRDTQVSVGLVVPTRDKVRPANEDLARSSDWVRSHLTDVELESAQLPRAVVANGKAAHKPFSWYRRPDLVEPAVAEATRVRGGRGPAMKWLGQANPYFGGRLPMEMLDTDEGARELNEYMAAWQRERG